MSANFLARQRLTRTPMESQQDIPGTIPPIIRIQGKELMTPDEVRMLDNRYAILFIRGERPILDEKFDILKHPNVGLTTDGNGKPYLHGTVGRAVASISLGDSLEGELTDDSLESEDYELLSDEDLEEIIQKYQ